MSSRRKSSRFKNKSPELSRSSAQFQPVHTPPGMNLGFMRLRAAKKISQQTSGGMDAPGAPKGGGARALSLNDEYTTPMLAKSEAVTASEDERSTRAVEAGDAQGILQQAEISCSLTTV